jgi:low affinity Fe/Cu permease
VELVASLTRVAVRIDRLMVIPWSSIMIFMGIVLALMLKWPIFGFLQGASQNWLLVSNILLLIMIVLIAAVFIPHNKKLESILRPALAEGRVTPELSAALNDKRNRISHYIEEFAILAIAALMVLKPF